MDIVHFLVEKGASITEINKEGEIPLHLAVLNGHQNVVEYFVKLGVDVNLKTSNKETALHQAATFSHMGIVQCLIENGADVNVVNSTILIVLFLLIQFILLHRKVLLIYWIFLFNMEQTLMQGTYG